MEVFWIFVKLNGFLCMKKSNIYTIFYSLILTGNVIVALFLTIEQIVHSLFVRYLNVFTVCKNL